MVIRHPQDQVPCWTLGAALKGTETIQNREKKKETVSLISRYCSVHLFPHYLEFQEQNSGNEHELLGLSTKKHSVLFS